MKGWTKPSGLRFIVEPRTVPLTRERYAIVRDTWTCEDDEYDSIREAYATAARMNANPLLGQKRLDLLAPCPQHRLIVRH